MAYIGSSAAVTPVAFSGVNAQSFNGDGSTVAFTLNRPVSSVAAIEVVVNNVQQSPYDGSYSVNDTTLTFSAAPSTGTGNIYVVYRDFPVGSITDPNTYTKTQTDTLLAGRVAKTGDTMTGNLIVNANVGIGTSSPVTKLDVSGKIRGYLNNTSVGNASSAQFIQDGTGDAAISFLMGVTTEWLAGVDNSDSDSFKISNITGGGDFTSTGMRIDSAGRVTMPYQPAFHALRTSGNVAIDTVVLWNQVLLNRGNVYNASTGRFTAPITGAYLLHARMNNSSGTGIHPELRINGTSNNYYRGFGYLSTGAIHHASISAVVQMTAGDYADVVTGGYSPMQGEPGYNNGFCGYLIG